MKEADHDERRAAWEFSRIEPGAIGLVQLRDLPLDVARHDHQPGPALPRRGGHLGLRRFGDSRLSASGSGSVAATIE